MERDSWKSCKECIYYRIRSGADYCKYLEHILDTMEIERTCNLYKKSETYKPKNGKNKANCEKCNYFMYGYYCDNLKEPARYRYRPGKCGYFKKFEKKSE